MDNGAGRTAQFNDGSERVREPQFHSMQQVEGNYRRTSVLDNLKPTGNGLGTADRQRQLMGINQSAIGQSEGNFDKSLWLRIANPVPRVKNGEANHG